MIALKSSSVLAFITAHGGTATYAEIRVGLKANPDELDSVLRGMGARKAVIQAAAGYQLVDYRPGAAPEPDEPDEPAPAPEPNTIGGRLAVVVIPKRLCLSCHVRRATWHFDDDGQECRRCKRKRERAEFAANRPPRSIS